MQTQTRLTMRVLQILLLSGSIGVSYGVHYFFSLFYAEPLLRRRRGRLHTRKAAQLSKAAIHLKGVLIKLGQFLSARIDLLPEEWTRELARLQDAVPPADPQAIRNRLRSDLGADPESIFLRFSSEPVAAASLGQVHEAQLRDGRRVAVKVQYPDIENVVEADLRAIRWVLVFLRLVFRRISFDFLYREFSRLLRDELDYVQEARNAERFAGLFADDSRIFSPTVIREYSTRHVLTLEYLDGIKIADYDSLERAGVDLREVARLLMASYMKQLFQIQFLHGDPHPGNLFVRPRSEAEGGPALIFVDFGLVQSISPEMREGIKTTVGGVIERSVPDIVRGLRSLGFIGRGPDVASIEQVAEFFIDKYRDIKPTAIRNIGLEEITEDLARIFSISSNLQVPNNFILIWRVVGMLSGLCSRLDPNLNIIEIAKPYALPFIRDDKPWADRLFETGTELAQALVALPRLLTEFLTEANRGNFQTKMSSEDVTGAILRVHRLLTKATLGILVVLLLTAGVYFETQGQSGQALAARVVAIGLGGTLVISLLRGNSNP